MTYEKLHTTAELAERLHLSPATLRRWAIAGRIPATRIGARVIRFDLEAVLATLSRERTRRGLQRRGTDAIGATFTELMHARECGHEAAANLAVEKLRGLGVVIRFVASAADRSEGRDAR